MKGKRGRAIVLWMAGTYLAAQLTAGLLFDYVWPQVRFPSAYQVFDMLTQAPPPGPEVICLGSSRMGCGFRPEVISPILQRELRDRRLSGANWTVPAGELVASDYLLTELLERGARPQVVVLEMVPDVLHCKMPWLDTIAMRQWTWADFPEYFVECCRSGQVVRLLSSRFQPLYAHRSSLWKQTWDWFTAPEPVVAAPPRPRKKGYKEGSKARREAQAPAQFGGPVAETPASPDLVEASRISVLGLPRQLRNYQIGRHGVRLVEHIYAQCREHDIELLLVVPPLASPHCAVYQPDIDPIFLAFLKEFCVRPGVSWHDYRTVVPDPLFVDHHHLSVAGGTLFSQQLTHQVLLPILQRRLAPDRVAAGPGK